MLVAQEIFLPAFSTFLFPFSAPLNDIIRFANVCAKINEVKSL